MERLVARKPDFQLCKDCIVGRGLGKLNLCDGLKREIIYANQMVEGGPMINVADVRDPDDERARNLILSNGSCEPLVQKFGEDADQPSQIPPEELGDLETIE